MSSLSWEPNVFPATGGHDLRLSGHVLRLRIQQLISHAKGIQQLGDDLRVLHVGGANEHRAPDAVGILHVASYSLEEQLKRF